MKPILLDVRRNNGTVEQMAFYFMPSKTSPGHYRLVNEKGSKKGWARKVGSKFEVAFNLIGIGSVPKTFTHKVRKTALMQAVAHHNASREGRVCIICQTEFDQPLPKYQGSHVCKEHANSNFIITLGGSPI